MSVQRILDLSRLGLFLAVLVFIVGWAIAPQKDLRAYACDPFGYLRQAQLFRDKGLIGGLDTRLLIPEANDLIAISKQIYIPPADGAEIVAPQCHHQDKRTDAVMLQYPPLSGFLLSFFPEPVAPPMLYITLMLVIGGCFLIATVRSGRVGWPTLVAGGIIVYEVFRILRIYGMIDSVSVPCSVGLVAVMALLTPELHKQMGWKRLLVALVVGFLGGALIGFRIANVLILLGIAFIGLTMPASIVEKLKTAVAGGLGLAIGMLPVLAANTINAGGPLHTTYNTIDASAPFFIPIMFYHHGRYYLFDDHSAPLIWVGLFAPILRMVMLAVQRRPLRDYFMAIGAGLAMLATFCFFMTHWIRIDYYMVPGAMFSAMLVFFDMVSDGGSEKAGRVRRWVSMVAILLFAGLGVWRYSQVTPKHYEASAPPAMLDKDARVWADMTTGSILYYTGKYAAKLTFGDECMRVAMLKAVSEQGKPQYLVADTPAMHDTIALVMPLTKLEITGTFRFDGQPYPVYLLKPGAAWDAKAPTTCSNPPF